MSTAYIWVIAIMVGSLAVEPLSSMVQDASAAYVRHERVADTRERVADMREARANVRSAAQERYERKWVMPEGAYCQCAPGFAHACVCELRAEGFVAYADTATAALQILKGMRKPERRK